MSKHFNISLKEFQKREDSTLKLKNISYLCFQVGFFLIRKESNKIPICELGKQVKLYAAAGTILLLSLLV